MPGRDQNGVDGIAGRTNEVIALEQAVGFGVADARLDGISAPQLAFDRGRADAAGVVDVGLGRAAMLVAAREAEQVDAIDAEAICEAAQRRGMRFVEVKCEEQQAAGSYSAHGICWCVDVHSSSTRSGGI